MSYRKEGWYFARHVDSDTWEVVHYKNGSYLGILVLEFQDGDEDYIVGDRIPTPGEPWQCVPVEMTPKMGEAVKGYNRFIDWEEALAAAPKPGS